MSTSPRSLGCRRPLRITVAHRPGFTLKESIAVVVIVIVVLAIVFPVMGRFRERTRRMECQSNLRKIGQAIDRYATSDSNGSLPIGAKYETANHGGGTSWWLDILPHLDGEKHSYRWVNHVNSGDFHRGVEVNANTDFADGFRIPIFFCPSSPLPLFSNPQQHLSENNRRQIEKREPAGIAVPMYTAVAGSAPDAREYHWEAGLDRAAGRNTADGPWGILSASGVFPPNRRLRRAAIFDQKDKTMMIVEQSDYARDDTLDPPDKFDVRNAWPKGAFMGATGNYDELSPTAPNLNGDGSERNWNITTVRYPLNTRNIKGKHGIYTDPAPPRPAKEGDPIPPAPPYPADGYGPGHNNPIISAHPEGVNILMFDGSVQFLNEKLDLGILLRMSTRDDLMNMDE